MTTSTPAPAPADDSVWGAVTALGARLGRTYLVTTAAVALLGISVAIAIGAVDSGGIEALGLGVAIAGFGLLASLVALPVLTIRAGLGWASVLGLFLVLAAEIIQSMTIGTISGALVVAAAGPGVVAVVTHVLSTR